MQEHFDFAIQRIHYVWTGLTKGKFFGLITYLGTNLGQIPTFHMNFLARPKNDELCDVYPVWHTSRQN